MVIHNPLTRSVFVVAIFWWTVFTFYAAATHPALFLSFNGLESVGHYVFTGLFGCTVGLVAGVSFVVWRRLSERLQRDRQLIGKGRLGMLCTLGNMPVETGPSLQIPGEIPAWFFDKKKIEYGPDIQVWLHAAQQRYPTHATALKAVIRVLCQFPHLPASHVVNGHGGKTLLDHSTRVAALAIKEAATFKYAGLVTKFGNEPWGDAGYDFDPLDPMIALIAFAHDIGKLATFTLDANGRVSGSRPGHDMIGSRLLATMDEIKALPALDQAALHRAISFYHHPSAYPLDSEGRIGDDRSVALMMLLIKADKRAGKEEAGNSLSPQDYAAYLRYMQDLGQELDSDEQKALSAPDLVGGPAAVRTGSRVISDEEMKAALLKILLDTTQVLAQNPTGNQFKLAVGQVNNTSYPQWAWDWKASGEEFDQDAANRLSESIERLIVLNEPKFRLALAKRLGLTEMQKKGDGRYLLTIHALRVMHAMGLLYTEIEDGNISPESALFSVQIQRNTDGSELASWRGAILLKPVGDLQKYATGTLHPSLVKVVRALWKDRRVHASADDGDEPSNSTSETIEYAPDNTAVEDDQHDANADEQPATDQVESEVSPWSQVTDASTSEIHPVQTTNEVQTPSIHEDETAVALAAPRAPITPLSAADAAMAQLMSASKKIVGNPASSRGRYADEFRASKGKKPGFK